MTALLGNDRCTPSKVARSGKVPSTTRASKEASVRCNPSTWPIVLSPKTANVRVRSFCSGTASRSNAISGAEELSKHRSSQRHKTLAPGAMASSWHGSCSKNTIEPHLMFHTSLVHIPDEKIFKNTQHHCDHLHTNRYMSTTYRTPITTNIHTPAPPMGATRLSSTHCAAVQLWATCCWVVSPHPLQQPGREAHLLIFPTKHDEATRHLVKQLLREVLPIWQPMQLPHHPPTASNTLPPQKTLILQHCTMWQTFNFGSNTFWRIQASFGGTKTSINCWEPEKINFS